MVVRKYKMYDDEMEVSQETGDYQLHYFSINYTLLNYTQTQAIMKMKVMEVFP